MSEEFRSKERSRREFVEKNGAGLGKDWGGLEEECILLGKSEKIWDKKIIS